MRRHRTQGISLTVSLSILIFLATTTGLWARVTTPQEAHLVVAGWLNGTIEPFEMPLGRDIVDVETFTGLAGEPIYYLVRLSPAGFVVVSADDLVEPILGFGDGQEYEPSDGDPLTALVTGDVTGRMAEAYSQSAGPLRAQSATPAQSKWYDLIDRASRPGREIGIAGVATISDVRVPPLLKTRWAQGSVCAAYCYNYYTPNHYLAGCVATAMAQVMYYHRYPAAGIGRRLFTVSVATEDQTAYTRGGDGAGGSYRWDDMALSPNCSTTEQQRQAIGALCYDAGLAVRMEYGLTVSLADAFAVAPKLTSVFQFSNAISGTSGKTVGAGLISMINPNLDAEHPVILTVTGGGGHAIVADGYGYDLSASTRTLYHHLNMGWGGNGDIWYNLPSVDKYSVVAACAYNLFIQGKGEIVSGRVTDASGRPVAGAVVRATSQTGGTYETTTNAKGIYALAKLPSSCLFTIEVQKPGFSFLRQTVATETSLDWKAFSGNRWGVDFAGASVANSDRDAVVDFVHFARFAGGAWSYSDLAVLAATWLTGGMSTAGVPVELPVLEN
jgi:hypothetical protein